MSIDTPNAKSTNTKQAVTSNLISMEMAPAYKNVNILQMLMPSLSDLSSGDIYQATCLPMHFLMLYRQNTESGQLINPTKASSDS